MIKVLIPVEISDYDFQKMWEKARILLDAQNNPSVKNWQMMDKKILVRQYLSKLLADSLSKQK